MYRLIILPLAISLSAIADTSGTPEVKKFGIKVPDMKIQTYAQLQGWGVYSTGRDAQIDSDSGLDKTDPRTNIYIRRGRLGFRGTPYKDLSYVLSMHYDNLGRDSMGATRGSTLPTISSAGASQGSLTSVGLWDSFLTWKIASSEIFNVTAGYFRPQISRESITAAFNVSSFEKAPSQNYVREAVIGRGFGRGTGINAGGLSEDKKFNYNVGIFNKVTTGETVGSTTLGETQGGNDHSLVYVGRAAWNFGDPEMQKYGLGYIINYFGKRNGLTLALNGSNQEISPKYKANRVIGGDFLYNWGAWQLDGEFFYIYKKNLGNDFYSRSRTGHIRGGHNFFLKNGTVLEPAVMVSSFYGEDGADNTGRDTVVDVGLNWYLDENRYKFYVHYVNQSGDGVNLENKESGNGYHFGDYAGVGLTLQI